MSEWQAQSERLADAVDELDNFNEAKSEYSALVDDVQSEFGDLLESTDFTFLNSWSGSTGGEFAVEYAHSYCSAYASDAGLNIVPTSPDGEDGPGASQSIETLHDTVKDSDVLIYPLGPDGKVKPEFAPVLDDALWRSLPQVIDNKAFGVQCNQGVTYDDQLGNMKSLKKALEQLTDER
ncbi:hypothetical protein BJF89_05370 [Corynebacterium sp. CNJ-954]|nr:hypothetical protein BJF89_05370 [Corynebacterium sp. CNJ-954]